MGAKECPHPGVKRLSRDQQAKLKENLTKKIHLQAKLKPISKVMAQTSEKYKITNPSLATRNQCNLSAVPPPADAGQTPRGGAFKYRRSSFAEKAAKE